MGNTLTAAEKADLLDRLFEELDVWGKGVLRLFNTLVGARATTKYMRDARGEPMRRRRNDSGPLRIVRGRLAASVLGVTTWTGRNEWIMEIRILSGHIVELIKGSKVPYAGVHENGFDGDVTVRGITYHMTIAKRAFLKPAIQDMLPKLRSLAQDELHDTVFRALGQSHDAVFGGLNR